MPEQLLDRTYVVTVFQKVCRKRMSKCVAARQFVDSGSADRFFDSSLEYRLVEMVPAAFAGYAVAVNTGGGKYPLQPSSRDALGYFRARASGSST